MGQIKPYPVPTITNLELEDVIVEYSEILVVFLMLPVLVQILLPLLLLVGFGLIFMARSVFVGRTLAPLSPRMKPLQKNYI